VRRRAGEVYVHYLNSDKRLDEWLPESACKLLPEKEPGNKRKRKRGHSSARQPSNSRPVLEADGAPAEDMTMTEEEYDIQHHKQITAQRNFEKVVFGKWQIKTWFVLSLFSPL
jgi:hypothetical protein